MKVTVLGVYGGYLRAGGANASLLLEEDGTSIVIDMGSGVLSQLEKVTSLDNVSAVILSHAHHDHVSDAPVAVYGRLISRQLKRQVGILPFYGPADENLASMLTLDDVSSCTIINENTVLHIGPFNLTFYGTVHPAECYAVKAVAKGKSVFYTSDTSYSPALINAASEPDLLFAECSILSKYGPGARMGHMDTHECAGFIRECNPARVRLIHIPCHGDIKELEAEAGYPAAVMGESFIL
ncbi:MAG: MBL fold metallo-hydrolase [Bullifex sp.]